MVAHVCGLNADVAARMSEGLGSDERTAHQVTTRAGRSLDSVCEEWIGNGDAMIRAIEEDGFFGLGLSADCVVHLHDLLHAVGQPIDRHDIGTISGGRTYATRTPDRLAEETGVGVIIDLGDGARFEPSTSAAGTSPLVLRATPYDFLRSVTGRRSRPAGGEQSAPARRAAVLGMDLSGEHLTELARVETHIAVGGGNGHAAPEQQDECVEFVSV